MRKILLGTTALICATTLLCKYAIAEEDPKVTVGGFNIFEAAWTKSDFDQGERDRAFRNDTEIHFNVAGKTGAGLGYGAEIDLQADVDGAGSYATLQYGQTGQTGSGIVARRTYGWLQGDGWGHLEFGSNEGVASTLKVDASNIARATGGINGDWRYFADTGINSYPSGFAFITAAALPVEHGPTNQFASDLWSNDDKVTYYTPRFQGFQAGLSYAPSLTNRGQLTDRSQSDLQNSGRAYQDIWEGGINYQGQFDQIAIAAGATGEISKTEESADNYFYHFENIKAWNAGAKLSYLGFSLAGSYGDWGNGLPGNVFEVFGGNPHGGTDGYGSLKKADYWTLGGDYETGPFGASVTYLSSVIKPSLSYFTVPPYLTEKFQNISLGMDYKLAPGLTPFIEYTWYDLDLSSSVGSVNSFQNKGNIVIVGSELSF